MWRPTKSGQGAFVGIVEAELDADRALIGARHTHRLERLQPPDALRGEVAGDAVDAERIGAVGRHADVEDRIVEPGPGGIKRADRGVGGQVDDALVLVGKAELALREEHAVRRLAAKHARLQLDAGAGDIRAGGGEDALHAGAGVGRAADHLHRRARAGRHQADAQPIGIRVLAGFDDVGDDERFQLLRRVGERLQLQAEMRQRVGDLLSRGARVEMVLQPGQGEFHDGSWSKRRCGCSALAEMRRGGKTGGGYAPQPLHVSQKLQRFVTRATLMSARRNVAETSAP